VPRGSLDTGIQCATIDQWPPMPPPLRAFLEHALPLLRRHPALVGVAAGGSFATGRMDEFSDLDLVVVAHPSSWPGVLDQRRALAASLGPLLVSFTGEHVGEPRLLICLYGPPLTHVDLKFVAPADLRVRVEDPVLLWDRDGSVAAALAQGHAAYPLPDLQWIEDRVWVWVHYGATKIGRGELLEACDFLAFLRTQVLGPLALQHAGARPNGVRRLEEQAGHLGELLRRTVATPDRADCIRAFQAAIALYRELLAVLAPAGLEQRTAAEQAATAYLDGLRTSLSADSPLEAS
jgi:hypothetical protein